MSEPEGDSPTGEQVAAAATESPGSLPGVPCLPPGDQPPPLPPARANVAHIIIPGTALWFVGFVVLLPFRGSLRQHGHLIWMWTCLAGGVLGCMGIAIYFWQRASARRGARGANDQALAEKL